MTKKEEMASETLKTEVQWGGVSVQEEVILFCPVLFSPLEIFALVPIKTV